MASKKFFVNIDLSKNQLINAVLESGGTAALASALTVVGQVGFDTDKQQISYLSGGTVQTLIAGTTNFIGNIATDAKSASVKAVYDYYNTNTDGGAGVIHINDAGNYFTASKVEGALQEIGAALNAVNSSMQVVGTFGATSIGAAVAYPTGAAKGDAYVVTGTTVDDYIKLGVNELYATAGSLVVCNVTGSTVDSGWFILDARREPSTETIRGIIALASNAEVLAGADTTKAVTAFNLKSYLVTNKFASIFTETAAVVGTPVTHNLGENVIAQVWLSGEEITSGVALTSADNTVTVNANNLTDTVKVVVTGQAVLA